MNSGNKHNRSVIVALTLALALTAGSGAVEAAGKRAPTGSGGGGSIQSFIDWCLGNGKGKTFSGGQFICCLYGNEEYKLRSGRMVQCVECNNVGREYTNCTAVKRNAVGKKVNQSTGVFAPPARKKRPLRPGTKKQGGGVLLAPSN